MEKYLANRWKPCGEGDSELSTICRPTRSLYITSLGSDRLKRIPNFWGWLLALLAVIESGSEIFRSVHVTIESSLKDYIYIFERLRVKVDRIKKYRRQF